MQIKGMTITYYIAGYRTNPILRNYVL